MENCQSSDFIDIRQYSETRMPYQSGTTSLAYKSYINGRSCFIKRLRPEFSHDKRYRELFYKEFNTGKNIRSPYIVEYLDIKEEAEGLCIIMEFVNGCTLKEKIEREAEYFRHEKNIRKLLLQLLEALKALHKENVVHLDINPANIIISQINNNVKLVDLGFCISDWNDRTAGSTALFSSPETALSDIEEIDARSDIYSIGCLLHYIEKETGTRLSRSLKSFMQRCLKEKKKQRFTDCDQAIDALKRRSKWLVVAGTASLIAAASVAVALLTPRVDSTMPQTEVALLTPRADSTMPQTEKVTKHGVEYTVLSHEDLTCMVVGGEGNNKNLYIEPEITIGNSVYRTVAIADSAFTRRDILSVHIPEGIVTIGNGAFYKCDSIVTINLPNSARVFNGAFASMRNLQRIKIPTIKDISTSAFVDAGKLTDSYLPEGVERICRDAFVSCAELKRVSLPQTLRILERGVFYNCKALEEITIPAGVTEIGDYAFYRCDSLHSVYCHAMTPPRITAIFNTANVTVYVPKEALSAYKKDFYWGSYNLEPMQN